MFACEKASLCLSAASTLIDANSDGYEDFVAQSRRGSLIEAATNTGVGYTLAVATQMVVFPVLDLQVGMIENLGLALVFTAVSLARTYMLRRLFDRWGI